MFLATNPFRAGSTGGEHHTGRAVLSLIPKDGDGRQETSLVESLIPEGVDRTKTILKRRLHCASSGPVASNNMNSRWHHVGGWPGNR